MKVKADDAKRVISAVVAQKEKGNELSKAGRFSDAKRHYKEALEAVEGIEVVGKDNGGGATSSMFSAKEKEAADELHTSLLANLCLCELKTKDYGSAVELG